MQSYEPHLYCLVPPKLKLLRVTHFQTLSQSTAYNPGDTKMMRNVLGSSAQDAAAPQLQRQKHPHSPVQIGFFELGRGVLNGRKKVDERAKFYAGIEKEATENLIKHAGKPIYDMDEVQGLKDRINYDDVQIGKAEKKNKYLKYIKWNTIKTRHVSRLDRISQTTSRLAEQEALIKARQEGPADTENEGEDAFDKTGRTSNESGMVLSPGTATHPNEEKFKRQILFQAAYNATYVVTRWPSAIRSSIEASITAIAQWLEAVNRETCVYWLWQKSESRRDDILRYVANKCAEGDALASAFFFPENPGAGFSPKTGFVPTLSQELTGYIPAFQVKLQTAYTTRGDFAFGRNIFTQAKEFLVMPYEKLPRRDRQRPLLIIINSLDRCNATQAFEIMDAMDYCVKRLPVCFLVSSTEEPWLVSKFDSWALKSRTVEGSYELPVDTSSSEP